MDKKPKPYFTGHGQSKEDSMGHFLFPPPPVVLFEKEKLSKISKECPNYSPIELGYEIYIRFQSLNSTDKHRYLKMANEAKYDPNEFSFYLTLYNQESSYVGTDEGYQKCINYLNEYYFANDIFSLSISFLDPELMN